MTEEKTSSEPIRGCGFRQVGKLYLIGDGIEYVCPSLPLPLDPCKICGYVPAQYRDFAWVPKDYFVDLKKHYPTGKTCLPTCPICYPESSNNQERYGLMWVGRQYYTPEDFIAEAIAMKVCKAIKQKPKGLILGKSWVLLAHPQAVDDHLHPDGKKTPGVFYAFKPTRIEVLVYKSDATPERLAELEAKGITPVIVLDRHKAHVKRTRKVRGRENIA